MLSTSTTSLAGSILSVAVAEHESRHAVHRARRPVVRADPVLVERVVEIDVVVRSRTAGSTATAISPRSSVRARPAGDGHRRARRPGRATPFLNSRITPGNLAIRMPPPGRNAAIHRACRPRVTSSSGNPAAASAPHAPARGADSGQQQDHERRHGQAAAAPDHKPPCHRTEHTPEISAQSRLGCGRFASPLGCGPGMFRTRQGSSRVLVPLTAVLACLFLPSAAGAHAIAMQPAAAMLGPGLLSAAPRSIRARCSPASSARSIQGSFVLLPFDVPAGTTAVRVKYCWDPPIGPFVRHTLDLGLYQARDHAGALYGPQAVPRLGRLEPPGRDRVPRGLQERGRVRREPAHERAGQDDARLHARPDQARASGQSSWGVAAIVTQVARRRGRQGRLARRDRALERSGVRRRALPARALRHAPRRGAARGWYAGDFHVHAEHSALGDATMTETFGFAFKPLARGRRRPRLHHALGLRRADARGARSAATSPTSRAS